MAQIGYAITRPAPLSDISPSIPTDESVGGMLFDISGYTNLFDDYSLLNNSFGNGQVQCIHNMDEASELGIVNNDFMSGLLYYHVSQFYEYVGGQQELYIMLADCSEDWDAVQVMQRSCSGRLFHIGVWTHQPIWTWKEDETVGFTSLITDLQAQASELCGEVGASINTAVPLHIVLFGNTNYVDDSFISYKKVPNAVELNCPKVSVILAQNGTEDVHNIQESSPYHAPVGIMGLVMGCLAVCGAEESIASVLSCNINKDERMSVPEYGFGVDYTPISEVNEAWVRTLSAYGYIMPILYDTKEGDVFLSSDQTLSEGDYKSIANNRIMHKCKRAVYTALLPYINSYHIYDLVTHNISVTSITVITDSINTLINSVMVNKAGESQIRNSNVSFNDSNQIIEDDTISLKLSVVPVNYSNIIEEDLSVIVSE